MTTKLTVHGPLPVPGSGSATVTVTPPAAGAAAVTGAEFRSANESSSTIRVDRRTATIVNLAERLRPTGDTK